MKTYTFHISLPGYGRLWRKVEMATEQTLQELHWAIQDAFDFDDDHLYSFFMSGKAWDRATEYKLPEGVDPWGLFSDDEEEDEEESEEDEELPSMDELIDREEEAEMLSSMPEIARRLESDPEFRRQAKEGMMKELGLPEFLADMMLDRLAPMMGRLTPEMLDEIFSLEEEEFAGDVRRTTLESLDLTAGKRFLYLFDYGDEWRFDVRVHAVREDADPDADYPVLVESVGEAPRQYPHWEEEGDDEDWDDDEVDDDWDDEEDDEEEE